MFQFNFNVGADAESDDALFLEEKGEDPCWPSYDVSRLMPSEEVKPPAGQGELSSMEEVEIAPGFTVLKGRVSGADAAALLNSEEVSASDLVPGVYEGGFKLWEGAVDLCHYMLKAYNIKAEDLVNAKTLDTPLTGKRVLELGCGHGLPGLLALMAGAEVHFQDYNKDVLKRLTIPNVDANMARLAPSRKRGTAKYFSGDWHCVGELLTSRGYGGFYDLILTSESIYAVESQRRLIECVKQVLQPPLGKVLVAAKSFYFGVGGGIKTFTQAVKYDGIFEMKSVYKTSKDVSNAMIPIQRKDPAGTSDINGSQSAAEQQQQGEGIVNTASKEPHRNGEGNAESQREEVEGATGDKQEASEQLQEGGKSEDKPQSGAAGDVGGNVREVLQLGFPESILPYFL